MIFNRINNNKSRLILWSICFFSFAACETTPKNQLDIIGKWNVVNADRNGNRTSTLEDAYFLFNADSTMVTNILREDVKSDYSLIGNTIAQRGSIPMEFKVVESFEDSLVLGSTIRNYEFIFYMIRDSLTSDNITDEPIL